MIILGIDTSCDETSVSVLSGQRIVAQRISSQVGQQREWGGVVPMLAQRMHKERIELVITDALIQAAPKLEWSREVKKNLLMVRKTLREGLGEKGLAQESPILPLTNDTHTISLIKQSKSFHSETNARGDLTLRYLPGIKNPGIELIAVTIGPGLAPALKVGLQAAAALTNSWETLFTPINHMEGHLWSGLAQNSKSQYLSSSRTATQIMPASITSRKQLADMPYPVLGALISGGHTELVLVKQFGDYQVIGEKMDDAAGEALDKFAVMLNLGYPGGAIIEALAKRVGEKELSKAREIFPLPVPMKLQPGLDFSFSGLKTAAMYLLREKAGLSNPTNAKHETSISQLTLSGKELAQFAASFQASVIESLTQRLQRAIQAHSPALILTGGGVINNLSLRQAFRKVGQKHNTAIVFPHKKLLVDNGSMIGIVGYFNCLTDRHIYTAVQLANSQITDRIPGLRIDDPLPFTD